MSVTPRRRLYRRLDEIDDRIHQIVTAIDDAVLDRLSGRLCRGVDRVEFVQVMLPMLAGHEWFDARPCAMALSAMFRAMDLNENGVVDFKEFLDALVLYGLFQNRSGPRAPRFRPHAAASIPGRRRSKLLLYSAELGAIIAHADGHLQAHLYDPAALHRFRDVALVHGNVNDLIAIVMPRTSMSVLVAATSSSISSTPLQTSAVTPSALSVTSPCTALASLMSGPIVAGFHDGTLALVEYGPNAQLSWLATSIPTLHRDEITSICSISTNLFVSGSLDRTVRGWAIRAYRRDGQNCAQVSKSATILFHLSQGVSTMAFDRDHCMLAAASYDRRVTIWNPYSSVRLFQRREHQATVVAIAFAGDTMITADIDGVIMTWNLTQCACSQVVVLPRGLV